MSHYSSASARRAFTAIELSVVIAIMTILITLTTQGVLSSMRTNAVNQTANAIERVISEARDLAMRAHTLNSIAPDAQFASNRYGVVIVDAAGPDTPGYVALTYGPQASVDHLLHNSRGEPALRVELPPSIRLSECVDDTATQLSAKGWIYDHRSAATLASVNQRSVTAFIGPAEMAASIINPSGVTQLGATLRLGTPDGRASLDMQVLPTGQARFSKP